MSFAGESEPLPPTEASLRPAHLELQAVVSAGRYTLLLSGELDLASAVLMTQTLPRVIGERTEELVLDLSRLTFADAAGLHAILDAKALCAERGCELRLIRGSAQVQRLFELSGALDVLPVQAEASARSGADRRQTPARGALPRLAGAGGPPPLAAGERGAGRSRFGG